MPLSIWSWEDITKTRYKLLTTSEDGLEETSKASSYLSNVAGSQCSLDNPRLKVSVGLLLLIIVAGIIYFTVIREVDKIESGNFMKTLNAEVSVWINHLEKATWNYMANLTDYNLQKKVEFDIAFGKWEKEQWNMLKMYDWKNFKDPLLKRQFKQFSVLGRAALSDEKKKLLDQILSTMQKIYSTTKLRQFRSKAGPIKDKDTKNISLEPDLVSIFASNDKSSCELTYYWEGWHGTVGRRVKTLFQQYVNLSNEAAVLNNFTNNAELWLDTYETKDFESHIHKLYLQILPFYRQLHAYVRNKLASKYNTHQQTVIRKNGPIPAHILGNVWAQQWPNIYNSTTPYPHKGSVDVTPEMKAQNYTVMKMFKLAEEFFLSLNLSAMTETFWMKSIFEKPKDREIVCHASAWNFYDGDDYRIKMCATVTFGALRTIHHEMGHVQYYQQYKDQPLIFQNGANPGFHEAVGDTLALSVSTADHLMKIGLLDPKTYTEDKESDINSLYLMALEKVAFLPFAYTLDMWRWEVFRGNITPSHYNCRYWELRQQLGGIMPPVDRNVDDFDPGAKYHVVSSTPYIRYFVSFIIQFQFQKALCIKAGQYDPDEPSSKPLHKCDIYQSAEAGNLFREMLQLGSSKSWQDAMQVLTGQREMDAGPLMEYFQPLIKWLELENKKTGQATGWTVDSKVNGCSNQLKSPSSVKTKYDTCRYTFDDNLRHEIEEEKENEEDQGNIMEKKETVSRTQT